MTAYAIVYRGLGIVPDGDKDIIVDRAGSLAEAVQIIQEYYAPIAEAEGVPGLYRVEKMAGDSSP